MDSITSSSTEIRCITLSLFICISTITSTKEAYIFTPCDVDVLGVLVGENQAKSIHFQSLNFSHIFQRSVEVLPLHSVFVVLYSHANIEHHVFLPWKRRKKDMSVRAVHLRLSASVLINRIDPREALESEKRTCRYDSIDASSCYIAHSECRFLNC